MSLRTNEIMYSIIRNTDLINCGQQLINFADIVYKEKNRTTLVKHFYESLHQWASFDIFGDLLNNNDKKNYFICNDTNAVRIFLLLRLPRETSTVKTIKEIKAFGEYILANYTKPIGNCISEDSLESILQFLEREYGFLSKVFSKNKTFFIRMHNSHKEYNGECLTTIKDDNIINHIFLYHMKNNDIINPEPVLFHELGHTLHTRCFGNVDIIPDYVIDILQDICFPSIKELSIDIQQELFADALSIGLMYKTPYEKYDFFIDRISKNQREGLKMLVEKILENISCKN